MILDINCSYDHHLFISLLPLPFSDKLELQKIVCSRNLNFWHENFLSFQKVWRLKLILEEILICLCWKMHKIHRINTSKNIAVGKHNPMMKFLRKFIFSPFGHFEFQFSMVAVKLLTEFWEIVVSSHLNYTSFSWNPRYSQPLTNKYKIGYQSYCMKEDILWWLVASITWSLINFSFLLVSVKQVGYQVYWEREYDRGILLCWYWVQRLYKI